jgi:hypothetical protein
MRLIDDNGVKLVRSRDSEQRREKRAARCLRRAEQKTLPAISDSRFYFLVLNRCLLTMPAIGTGVIGSGSLEQNRSPFALLYCKTDGRYNNNRQLPFWRE